MSNVKLLKLLPEFKRRFFHNYGKEKIPYGTQRICKVDDPAKKMVKGKVGYHRNDSGTITDSLLHRHFSQELIEDRYYDYASLAVLWKSNTVKWICFDADSEKQVDETHEKLLPALREYGLVYLIETSRGTNENPDKIRMHIWVLTNITQQTAEKFCTQLFIEQGMIKKEWEIYPLFDRYNAIIRIPGGYHIKAGKANGVIWDGVESSDPEFILKAFNSLPIYDEATISSKLKALDTPSIEKPKREKNNFKKFVYIPRNLPKPMEGMPKYIERLATECQCIRKLIFDMVNEDGIQERGIPYHNSLLALSGIAYFMDKVLHTTEGRDWWDNALSEYRDRDAIEHQVDPWEKNKNPNTGMWRCETYEKYFDFCKGCPFKDRDGFDNPKQLYFGKRIEKVKVMDVEKS